MKVKNMLHTLSLCALLLLGAFTSSVWGNTAKSSNSSADVNASNQLVISNEHVTFTFSGTDGVSWNSDKKAYKLKEVLNQSTSEYALTWNCNSDCEITVTGIAFWCLAYNSNAFNAGKGKIAFNGKTSPVGTASTSYKDGDYAKISETGTFNSGIKIVCQNDNNGLDNKFRYYIKNLVITYTISPKKPGLVSSRDTVNVTLNSANLSANAPQTVFLPSRFTKSGHLGDTLQFQFASNPGSAGVITSDSNFYATDTGTYVLQARYKALTNCHEESGWSNNYTIYVQRLNQTVSWNNSDTIQENIQLGATKTIGATASSGLGITYSSDNTTALSINSTTGVMTANAIGEARITATQAGNAKYNPASTYFDFEVKDMATPVFTPSGFSEASTKALNVGESVTLAVSNVSDGLDGDFTATSDGDGTLQFTRVGNTITITAYRAGDVDAVFVQTENEDIFGASKTYSFSVSKNAPTITVPSDQTLYVDGEYTASSLAYSNTSKLVPDSGATDHDFYYTISHSLSSEVNKSNVVITFNPSTKKIIAQNAGTATITIYQKATREYSAESNSFTITVNKYITDLDGFVDEMLVDATPQIGTYKAENTSATYPSEGTSNDFYYTITDVVLHTPTVVTGCAEGHESDVIGYTPSTHTITAYNAGTATLTIAQKETYKYTGETLQMNIIVNKHNPEFTWHTPVGSKYYYKHDYAAIFESTNEDYAATSSSSNANVAEMDGYTLHVYNVDEDDCEITMTQAENYYWNGKSVSYPVVPSDNNNKLPFSTWSQAELNRFKYEAVADPDGSVVWTSGYLKLEGDGSASEKHIILHFEGIPDSLFYDFGLQYRVGGGSGTYWYVAEGPTLDALDTIHSQEYGSTSWHSDKHGRKKLKLSPTSRYVSLSYTGTSGACFQNIEITTVADKFSASADELNFGLQGQNFGEQVKTINFDHVNAGRVTNVKIIGADAEKYSVTPTTIPGTGRECYGTTTLRVAFDNGETERAEDVPYSAQLVVYDNNDHTDTVNLVGYRHGKSIPVFTFNPNHVAYYFGDTIHTPAISRNEQVGLTYSTSNRSIADIVDGKLVIKSTSSPVTITVHQVETEDFRAHDEGFTFTPRQKPSLNVPFMMNERIYNGSCVTVGSKCGWQDDDCIRTGNFQSAVYWGDGNDKKIIIEFGGVPDKLSFELKNWAPAIEERWRVEESSDGSNWTEIWYSSDAHDGSSWDPVGPIQLSPTTHFVRLSYGGNYMGYFNNISITALDGVKYMMTDDNKYLSRGGAYGTRAVVDDYGVPVRVTRYAPDTMNTTFYTKVQFMDSRDYLFESDSKVYTDAGGRSGDQWIQSVVGGKVLVQNVGSSKYITVADNKLEVTSDADAATRWTAEDYTVHADRIETKLNEMAARAAGPDFGTDVNTLEKMRTQVALQKFVKDTITIPTVAVDEQGGEYRTSVGTNAVYDNTIEGLEPGLYRLTIQALYRPAPSPTDWTNHDNGMESVVAYIYANESKFPIKSIFDETGSSATAIGAGKDTVCGGYHYAVNKAAAAKVFEDRNSYLHDVYVYVNADEGKTTGTLSYGIKNPSYVPGAWLAYGNATLELIKRRKYIFDGGAGTTVWNTLSNWEYEGGVPAEAPGPYDAVIIRDTVVVAGQVSVYGVTIEGSNLMTIAPTGGLTVGEGGVVNSNVRNLVLQVDQDAESATRGQVGYLRISPKCAVDMPKAILEYLRLGYTNCGVTDGTAEITGYSTWQYLGCPVQAAGKKIKSVIAGWINSWDESTGTWVNNRATATVSPFIGFANSQDLNSTGALSKFNGQLIEARSYDVSLTYTESESSLKGWNLLANSFSAPMVISQMDFPTQTDSTVYLFNTGSTEHASAEDDGEGTYTSVPAKFAGETVTIKGMSYTFPNTIPSMQGFFVKAKANTTLTIDYAKTVWNATYTASTNKPLRARAEHADNAENEYRAMFVSMEANGQRDIVRIIESEKFSTSIDGGYDAQILPAGNFNIFTIEDDAHLSVNATNSIIGTRVGVRTGEETAYTMTFNYEDDDLALVDVETGDELEIFDGMQYTFFAEPNTEITERFMIVERADAPSVTTGVDNTQSDVKVSKFIKDGQLFILKNGVLYDATGARVK